MERPPCFSVSTREQALADFPLVVLLGECEEIVPTGALIFVDKGDFSVP